MCLILLCLYLKQAVGVRIGDAFLSLSPKELKDKLLPKKLVHYGLPWKNISRTVLQIISLLLSLFARKKVTKEMHPAIYAPKGCLGLRPSLRCSKQTGACGNSPRYHVSQTVGVFAYRRAISFVFPLLGYVAMGKRTKETE
jgi:hypothetical protein